MKMRVWHIPQVPGKPFKVEIEEDDIEKCIEKAKMVLDVLAIYDQFEFQNKIKPDFSNAQGVEIFEDGKWVDFHYGDDNQTFEDYCYSIYLEYGSKLIEDNDIKF